MLLLLGCSTCAGSARTRSRAGDGRAGLSGAVRGVTVRGVTAAVTPDVLLPGCRSPEGSVEGRPVPSVAWLANSGVCELEHSICPAVAVREIE